MTIKKDFLEKLDFWKAIDDALDLERAFTWEGNAYIRSMALVNGNILCQISGTSGVEHSGDEDGIYSQVEALSKKGGSATFEYEGKSYSAEIISAHITRMSAQASDGESERDEESDGDYSVRVEGEVMLRVKPAASEKKAKIKATAEERESTFDAWKAANPEDSVGQAAVAHFFLGDRDKNSNPFAGGEGFYRLRLTDKRENGPDAAYPQFSQMLLDMDMEVGAALDAGDVEFLHDSVGVPMQDLFNKVNGSKVKASASFSDAKKSLEDFLARNPDISKDASITRGGGSDDTLKGAIASMTFEGEGSLFDTMNYGTRNPERDKQVLNDLAKTLREIGCYYEMGHDWSLGVFPLEEDEEDKATRTAVDNLAQALGEDPEDLTIESTITTGAGTVVNISHGNTTYMVGDSDAFEKMATEQAEEQVDEDIEQLRKGKDPIYLSADSYIRYVDNQAVLDAAREIASELAQNDVEELSSAEKREWLDENESGWDAKLPPEADDDDIEAAAEEAFGYGESWVEQQAMNQVPDFNAAYDYLAELNGGGSNQDLAAYLASAGLIDTDWAVKDMMMDGAEAILGGELYEDSTITYIKM